MKRALTTSMCSASVLPLHASPPRDAAFNAPITNDLRESLAHRLHEIGAFALAAQTELAMGETGRVGNLAAHFADALAAFEAARAALEEEAAGVLAGADLASFGWRARALDDEPDAAA